MAAPQQEHQPFPFPVQVFNGLVGELFPALLLVRGRLTGFHGKYGVEQQHALPGPVGQVAMGRWLDTQIPVDFLVNIDQRRRRFHAALHGKAQAMGLIGAVVRVLPEDHHLHLVEGRQVEGVEDIRAGREHGFSRPLLPCQKGTQPGHIVLFELPGQMLFPARLQLHVLGAAVSHGVTTCPAGYTCAFQQTPGRSFPGAPADAAQWTSWSSGPAPHPGADAHCRTALSR